MTQLARRTLSPAEKSKKGRCIEIVDKGQKSFVEVGQALMTIRDDGLHQDEFDTFEEFCRERWGWTGRRAYQMIEAASVVASLERLGDVNNCSHGVTNEAQARELGKVQESSRKLVLNEASKDGKATAKTIREKAREIVGKALAKQPKRLHGSPAKASQDTFWDDAARQLDGIWKVLRGRLRANDEPWVTPTVFEQFEGFGDLFRSYAFGCVCQECQGEGCQECRRSGWLPKHQEFNARVIRGEVG